MKTNKLLLGIILGTVFFFTACSQKTTDSSANKKEVVIATSVSPNPFTYVDEDNELTGFDIEVVKAIFEELPTYDISFEKTEFTSILAGLDTNRYQIGANNFAMNEERKEKYIYSEPIFKNQYAIALPQSAENLTSFQALKGKSTEVSPCLNYATALENYNQENPETVIDINYSEADLLTVLQNVESGKYDFQLIDKAMGQKYLDEHGLKLKLIDLSSEDVQRMGTSYSYLLLSKTDEGEKLSQEINQALKKIIENGTVSKISQQFLQGDYAPKIETGAGK